jgi:hypothetical protein
MTEKGKEGTHSGLWWEEGLEEKWEEDARDAVPPDVVWVAADKRVIPVVEMEDAHLMNVLRYVSRLDGDQLDYLVRKSGKMPYRSSRREKILAVVPVLPYLEKEARRRGFTPPRISGGAAKVTTSIPGAANTAAEVRARIGEYADEPLGAKPKKPRDVAKQEPDGRPIEVRRFALLELPDNEFENSPVDSDDF